MNRCLAALFAAALSSLALPAGAQVVEAPAPGLREHDGFFLQLQTGPAFLDVSQDRIGVGGSGFGLHLAAGGSPIENLVLYGEVFTQWATRPTLEVDGEEFESDDSTSLSLTHFAPGVAYYFGRSNFFLGGSVGWTEAELEVGSRQAGASGVGVRIGAGKEWWIADQWGLGVGANFFTASLADDEDEDARLNATSFAVNLTATFH